MTVAIRFLGGLGVIGRNSMAIIDGNDAIVIDAGLYFPELSAFGVDIALPDFRAIDDIASIVKAVIITHGHEDHIGALGSLAERISAPIYGSRVAMALASNRLQESNSPNEVRIVQDYETIQVGQLRITFYPVAHSVPDSMALKIDSSEGTIYHTGDFKLDPSPLDSRSTDLGPLARLGKDGAVDLLLIDSTNAEEPGWTESELAVRPAIREVFTKYNTRRIICSCFASHIHRVAQIVAEARLHQRKIVPAGRSMVRIFEIARNLGLITIPDNELMTLHDVRRLAPSEVCILSTGSQGEPRAALSLMARGEHRQISLHPSDVILLSSDAIPGNESDVGQLIDQLTRRGVDVVHAGSTKVHVSGHAKRDELRHVIWTANARAVIPIHGEYRHMMSTVRLVQETTPNASTLVAQDGFEVELAGGTISKAREFPAPYIYRSNSAGPGVSQTILNERMTLQTSGVLFLSIYATNKRIQAATAQQFGWLDRSIFETISTPITDELARIATEAIARGVSTKDIESHVQSKMRRFARRMGGSSPLTLVLFEHDQP